MGRYFSDEVLSHGKQARMTGLTKDLHEIVKRFPPTLKQAMYAATAKGGLKAGTWTNCAFNAAGSQEGVVVRSTATAADVFGIDESLVRTFIHRWDDADKMSDRARTSSLSNALLVAGLTTPAWDNDSRRRTIYQSVVFKGAQTEFIEALDKVESLADMPGFSDLHVEALQELMPC